MLIFPGPSASRPPQAVKGIMYIRNRVSILVGDCVDPPIVYAEPISTIRLLGRLERPRVNQRVL